VNGPRRRLLIYSEVFPSEGAGIVRQTGVGRYCYELAEGLGETGHHVAVLTNRDEGHGLEQQKLPFALLRRGAVPRHPHSWVTRALEVRRAIAETRAEHVIAGDLISQKVLAVAGVLGRIPSLPVLYGSELRSYGTAFSASSSSPRHAVRRVLLRRYFARLRGCICISHFAERELRRLPLAPPGSVIVHPAVRSLFLTRPVNPWFEAAVRTKLSDVDGPAIRVVTVGRISERKNQLTVLRAIAAASQHATARFQYIIVGNVDSDRHTPYLREVREFIGRHQLTGSVSFVEGTADEDKIDWIDACDIVVAVSRTVGSSVEGFGISAIEGSARGKPVIVSDEGGMPETIREGITGFSVPSEAHEQLGRLLADLAADVTRRRAVGDAGRAFVNEAFTPGRMGESLTAWLDGFQATADRWA
jgi:glycosyltransferase involved in cell wall biosynthesis